DVTTTGGAPGGADALLAMRGVQKAFGAVRALTGVDLHVGRAEVHALIGENGAGKSTLMKVLSGALKPDAGAMQLDGRGYAPRGPLEARQRGVCMIYQELTLALHLSVAENLFLGREPRRFGLCDWRLMRERAAAALALLEQPELSPDRRVEQLSPGARQLVEIARALVFEAKLVVMDEPTSSLSQREVERLFGIIQRLRARGVSVIYISHFLEEVRRVAQRYTVLRDGASVASGQVPGEAGSAAQFERDVLRMMAGREAAEAYPRCVRRPGPLCLEVADVRGQRAPQSASFTLHSGEILGIFGLVGAGRSELLRVLFGLDPQAAGRERSRAEAALVARRNTPAGRWAEGLGLVSENRKEEGLALGLGIAENLTLSRPAARHGLRSPSAERAATQRLGQRLSLRYRDPAQPVRQLSGGNQQKVALLRLLHHDVDVYLLDEPTRGIDVSSKSEIYRLLAELAAQSKAVLLVSSYLPELLGVCDRIAVMARGRLSEPQPVAAWTSEALLAAATSMDAVADATALEAARAEDA
ncbi:MAG TPA: sugar ABC transporter ATP-binding protein, partial [Polyangiales bacterium]